MLYYKHRVGVHMKNIIKSFVIVIILTLLISPLNIVSAKYSVGQEVSSYEDIPNNIKVQKDNPGPVYGKYDLNDPLDIFNDKDAAEMPINRSPMIQYIADSGSNFTEWTYVFCINFGNSSPTPDVVYNKTNFQEDLDNDLKIEYIIRNGFKNDYDDTAEGKTQMQYDYYVTQIAIWKVQDLYNFEMANENPFDPNDTNNPDSEWKYNMYQHVLNLVAEATEYAETAKESDVNYIVAKYMPTDDQYQGMVPAILYPLKKDEPPKVDIPDEPTIPQTPINTRVSITYKDKCTFEYVQKAKMKLVRGSSCSATALHSWTSTEQDYIITGLEAGTYTVCDTTNNYSKTINVTSTNNLQNFDMLTNPDTCDEPKEETVPSPPTGVLSLISLCLFLGGTIGLYIYAKKKTKYFNKF